MLFNYKPKTVIPPIAETHTTSMMSYCLGGLAAFDMSWLPGLEMVMMMMVCLCKQW